MQISNFLFLFSDYTRVALYDSAIKTILIATQIYTNVYLNLLTRGAEGSAVF